jgi:hypothetical protein
MWAVRKKPLHQHRLPCHIRPMESLVRRLLQAASAGRFPVRNIRHLQLSLLDCNVRKASQRCCKQNRERSHIFSTTPQRTSIGVQAKVRFVPRAHTHLPPPSFRKPWLVSHSLYIRRSRASHEHLDIIIGFQIGDLIWFGESVQTKLSSYCTSHDRRPDRIKIRATEQAGKTIGKGLPRYR